MEQLTRRQEDLITLQAFWAATFPKFADTMPTERLFARWLFVGSVQTCMEAMSMLAADGNKSHKRSADRIYQVVFEMLVKARYE